MLHRQSFYRVIVYLQLLYICFSGAVLSGDNQFSGFADGFGVDGTEFYLI